MTRQRNNVARVVWTYLRWSLVPEAGVEVLIDLLYTRNGQYKCYSFCSSTKHVSETLINYNNFNNNSYLHDYSTRAHVL